VEYSINCHPHHSQSSHSLKGIKRVTVPLQTPLFIPCVLVASSLPVNAAAPGYNVLMCAVSYADCRQFVCHAPIQVKLVTHRQQYTSTQPLVSMAAQNNRCYQNKPGPNAYMEAENINGNAVVTEYPPFTACCCLDIPRTPST